jgi:DNA polymerase IIIc chi subunit
MASFERVFNLFDGRSEAQVGQARARWAALREQADTQMRYFAQDDAGKWEQRA